MPLNKLENFIKNYEGRILYVNSNDLDATDSVTNQGNSLTKPFKTIQRALIESARFSFVTGNDNDKNDRTTILVFPGEHLIDNRPGFGIRKTGTATASVESPSGQITSPASDKLTLTLESNFDLTQEDNILFKFNSIHGGVILPRGTSLVGLDLRKTKIRPKYVPNPTDDTVPSSAIFRITGNCYFWQFSLFDGNQDEFVYTNNKIFTEGSGNRSVPTFSHHKLTCFEYADGVNVPTGYDLTDLDMYYAKLSQAFNEGSGRQIPASQKFPLAPLAFAKERPEWEIVGAFASDPVNISSIISGDGATPNQVVTVTTTTPHGLTAGTPIKIRGINTNDYNVSTVVQSADSSTTFTYLLAFVRNDLDASPSGSGTVTIETDTVKGSSPYIFNTSLRSVWGMNGMKTDGSKASGFKSMVVAQFTAISLQKDDRSFVKYDPITRTYSGIPYTSPTTGALLSSESSSTTTATVYHLDGSAIYRPGWETSHIKVTNDSVIQVVSVFAIGFNKHFDAESGGDASITNSNSNFGQFALAADGFRKDAFDKDDHGFITSIITPKHITATERNIDWISIDVGLTTAVGVSSHLYLFGFNTRDNVPPNLLQGYRIGARVNDKLHLTLPNGTTKTANILMTDNIVSTSSTLAQGTSSAFKEYTVSAVTTAPNYDTLTLSSNHTLLTGSKILIFSDDGDIPENITENRVYYAIVTGVNSLKVASSFTNAQNGTAITMYGGTNLRIVSRLSDINAGEIGSPIQYDPTRSNWFVFVDTANQIYPEISSLGVTGFEEPRTDVTFIKRIEDPRSLDEKIYKVRIVVPKESVNAKDIQDGFILQESSTTGPINNSEFSLTNITAQNYNYKRNPRFISTCSESSGTVTVITELPHNLSVNDRVLIKNVKSSTNLTGAGVTGYNGDFTVGAILDNKTFTYSTTDINAITHNVGIFSGITARNTSLPRFERNDLKSNLYIYRAETLSSYIYNVQDGVYHAYILNAKNPVPHTFTNYKYSQSIVDLYPQKDPDNINDNPTAAKTFAKRAPLGEVTTSDLKRSVSRETVDELVKKIGLTPIVSTITATSGGISTITTTHRHGLNGIVGYTTLTTGTGYSIGTYFNVRLLNQSSTWDGATADLVISGAASSITSLQIVDGGAGYGTTTLTIDGFSGSTVAITTNTVSGAENNSIQITGLGTVTDSLYRIVSIPSANQISIARTSGDPSVSSGQYIFNVAPTSVVTTVAYNATSGISTISCTSAHGLVAGNKFKIVDSSNNNLGDFVVNDLVGINTFTFKSPTNLSSAHRVLKHGFSANDLVSEAGTENLASRGVSFYGNETAILLEDIGTGTVGVSTFSISSSNSGLSTTTRFALGNYVQINDEIMRIVSSTLSGAGNNQISVLRGVLGTQKSTHLQNSLIKKIKPIAIELRRPSILRASGHTFEYLGYGPGNYSTALPQIQAKTITEREDFLSQSQEKSCGSVVYTGMNSDGDFFIGNTKYSSVSGEQTTFDIPIPTVTGQDPSRLSAVFDEIIVKERILVEGGKSKQILSQFDGPVTFNENVIVNDEFKLNGDLITTGLIIQKNVTESISPTTGSITTKGGLGVAKNVNIGGNLNITGITTFNNQVSFNSGLVPDDFEGAYIGTDAKPWASAWIAGIGIATEGVPGGTEVQDRTINAWTGDLVLTSTVGIVSVTDNLEVGVDLLVKGNSRFIGLATFQSNTRHEDNDKALFGDGGDLEIFHDGSNSFIKDTGTGSLIVNTNNLQLKNAANDETGLVFTQDGSVELYFNNSKKLETTNNGLNITGVTTSSDGFFPLSDSGAPLGSLALSFSEAFVDNLKLDGNTFSSTSGGITIDANDNQITTSDNVSITGVTTITGQLNVDNLRLDGNTFSSTSGDITIDSAGGTITLADNVSITGFTTFIEKVTFNAGIVPDTDKGAYIGQTGSAWSEGWIGNLKLAVGTGGDTETTITTSAGGLFLDSTLGETKVEDNLWANGTLRVESTSSFRDSSVIEGSSKLLQLKDSVGGNVRVELSSAGQIKLKNTAGTNLFSVDADGNTSTSGILAITNTTDSSSSTDTNASFRTAGGGAIAKKLFVGDTLTVSKGGLTVSEGGLTVSSGGLTVSTGGLTVSAGGISASGQTITAGTFSGNATSSDTVDTTSTSDNSNDYFLLFADSSGGDSGETIRVNPNFYIRPHSTASSANLSVRGDITAFAGAASDDSLKTDREIIPNALDKVLSLSGFTFTWNDKAVSLGFVAGVSQVGVSAQQVRDVLPEAVKTESLDGEEILIVKYEKIVPLLIEAIKELKSEIDELKKTR